MRIIALLASVTVAVVGNDFNNFVRAQQGVQNGNRLGFFLPQQKFFDTAKTLTNSLRPSKEQKTIIQLKLKEIAANSSGYYQNLSKPIGKISSEQGIERTLYQSEITLTEKPAEQVFKGVEKVTRSKRQVFKDHNYPNMTWLDDVFYTFNTSDQSVQKAFKMGIKVWTDNTCIDFIEDKNAKDKVVLVSEEGCWSSIGRQGGDQLFSLDKECATEACAVHEMGHILGLLHTISRYDRDSYIRIDKRNVDPRKMNEFGKVSKKHSDVYGLSYDYGSIMHYNELSGSVNDKPTVIALDPHYQKTMGSDLISFSDIFVINEHYGCNANCNKSTSARCENEGFPHPRNCSICICPSGYGGALCDRRPPGCGEDLVATSRKRTLTYRLGFGSSLRDQFSFCNYMITAPVGKKIQIDVQSISYGYDEPGCIKGGIEIKAQTDQKLTGYRFCSMKGSGGPILSSSNRLPVILFNKFGAMQTVFTYRYID